MKYEFVSLPSAGKQTFVPRLLEKGYISNPHTIAKKFYLLLNIDKYCNYSGLNFNNIFQEVIKEEVGFDE